LEKELLLSLNVANRFAHCLSHWLTHFKEFVVKVSDVLYSDGIYLLSLCNCEAHIFLEYVTQSNNIAPQRDYIATRWWLKLQLWLLWQKQFTSVCAWTALKMWPTELLPDTGSDYLRATKNIFLYYFQCTQQMGVKPLVLLQEISLRPGTFRSMKRRFSYFLHILNRCISLTLAQTDPLAASLLCSDRLHLAWYNGCAAACIHKV